RRRYDSGRLYDRRITCARRRAVARDISEGRRRRRQPSLDANAELGLAALSDPAAKELDVLGAPEGSARRHLRLARAIEKLQYSLCVFRVGHVVVIVEQHVHSRHVIDINLTEERFDVPFEGYCVVCHRYTPICFTSVPSSWSSCGSTRLPI